MSDSGFLENLAIDVLREAVPGREVVQVKRKVGPRRARTDTRGSLLIKHAYLTPGAEASLIFSVYPGDTLEQARRLYRNPSTVDSLLTLEKEGWTTRPNFHFGFMSKGFCWTTSSLSTADYAHYWIQWIEELRIYRRPDWDSAIAQLIQDGMMAEDDRQKFQDSFVTSKRGNAIPRPGIAIEYSWSITSSLNGLLSLEVRQAIERIEKICAT